MAFLTLSSLMYLGYLLWLTKIKKQVVLEGASGTILTFFTVAVVINLVTTGTLAFTEQMITIRNDGKSNLTTYMLFMIRITIEFVASQSQLLCVFLFFFKLKQVEIQIDIQLGTLQEIMHHLKRLKNGVRCAAAILLSIKLIFISFYTVVNIFEAIYKIEDYNND